MNTTPSSSMEKPNYKNSEPLFDYLYCFRSAIYSNLEISKEFHPQLQSLLDGKDIKIAYYSDKDQSIKFVIEGMEIERDLLIDIVRLMEECGGKSSSCQIQHPKEYRMDVLEAKSNGDISFRELDFIDPQYLITIEGDFSPTEEVSAPYESAYLDSFRHVVGDFDPVKCSAFNKSQRAEKMQRFASGFDDLVNGEFYFIGDYWWYGIKSKDYKERRLTKIRFSFYTVSIDANLICRFCELFEAMNYPPAKISIERPIGEKVAEASYSRQNGLDIKML